MTDHRTSKHIQDVSLYLHFLITSMIDHGTHNTSSWWVCLCFLDDLHHWSWHLTTHPVSESVFVFPEKLHDWSCYLKTQPESESVSVFPEKLYDWSWQPKKHIQRVSLCLHFLGSWLHDWCAQFVSSSFFSILPQLSPLFFLRMRIQRPFQTLSIHNLMSVLIVKNT